MMKCECLHWESLEPSENTPILKLPKDVPPKDANPSGTESGEKDGNIHKYPSSSHYTRDWDKLVAEVKQEEKDEKPEGDAALNKLFQQIYSDGSDETKKAMNKSFVSSIKDTYVPITILSSSLLDAVWRNCPQYQLE